jgi:hypothetical protein
MSELAQRHLGRHPGDRRAALLAEKPEGSSRADSSWFFALTAGISFTLMVRLLPLVLLFSSAAIFSRAAADHGFVCWHRQHGDHVFVQVFFDGIGKNPAIVAAIVMNIFNVLFLLDLHFRKPGRRTWMGGAGYRKFPVDRPGRRAGQPFRNTAACTTPSP